MTNEELDQTIARIRNDGELPAVYKRYSENVDFAIDDLLRIEGSYMTYRNDTWRVSLPVRPHVETSAWDRNLAIAICNAYIGLFKLLNYEEPNHSNQ